MKFLPLNLTSCIFLIFSVGDPCSPEPCLNGGTCTPESNPLGFECSCPSGYIGFNCGVEQGMRLSPKVQSIIVPNFKDLLNS